VADDGTYSAVIGRECLAGGRINIKVYAEGKAGVTNLNLNPLGTYVSDCMLNTVIVQYSLSVHLHDRTSL